MKLSEVSLATRIEDSSSNLQLRIKIEYFCQITGIEGPGSTVQTHWG